MKLNFGTVLFDFDGTLFDSSEGVFKSLKYAFRADNKPEPTDEELRRFIGPPIYDSFKSFYSYDDEKNRFYGGKVPREIPRKGPLGIKGLRRHTRAFEKAARLRRENSHRVVKAGAIYNKHSEEKTKPIRLFRLCRRRHF